MQEKQLKDILPDADDLGHSEEFAKSVLNYCDLILRDIRGKIRQAHSQSVSEIRYRLPKSMSFRVSAGGSAFTHVSVHAKVLQLLEEKGYQLWECDDTETYREVEISWNHSDFNTEKNDEEYLQKLPRRKPRRRPASSSTGRR